MPYRWPATLQAKTVDTAMSLDANGKAWAWGRVGAGGDAGAALGGTATDTILNGANGYPRQVPIPGDPALSMIAADRRTAVAATADTGQVWAWGAGSYLHPDSKSQYTYRGYDPKAVMKADGTPLDGITLLAASERNAAIAVDTEGSIWRWGNPVQGGVDGYVPQASPLPAGEKGRPMSVMGGYYMVGTVLDNGNVYVWGRTTAGSHGGNHRNELPGNQSVNSSTDATLVNGLQAWNRENSPDSYVVQVGFGGFDWGYGVALLSDGRVLSWGQNQLVTGHPDPTTPAIVADNVAVLAPNFYGVAYLREPDDPDAVGYELWGYGPSNYSLGNGSVPVKIDDNVTSVQPGMGFNLWMRVDAAGGLQGVYGRGYNPQGAVGLNAAGTGPQGGETTVREIRFPGKTPSDLSFLGS
ncbi:hypothetical protein GCM10009847_18010 [Leucobacter tardus]